VIHLSVVSPKGGMGKTLLTLNLAASFAHDGHRVCVVDHDPQGSALVFGKIAERAGIELPFVPTSARVSGFDICLHDHPPGVVEHYPSKILIMPVVLDAPSGAIHLRGKTLLTERGLNILEVVNRFRADRAEPRRLLANQFSHCPVINERTLYSNLYGQGRTVFTASKIPYLDRAQAEILAVRQALDALMEEVAI
jgi:chromosome partitioning protein